MFRKIIFFGFILIFAVSGFFAQDGFGYMHGKKRQHLRQLEQLKLIEILDLNEDVSARFFARRKKHLNKIQQFQLEKRELIKELENKLKNKEKINTKEYINKIEEIDQKIFDEKKRFYHSLDDLLTNEQIAKFIVFQTRFKKEIMRQMMRQNRSRMPNN
jgi:hypothetical protein